MSENLNEKSGDHCHLTSRAWKLIRADLEKQLGRTLDNWTGPKITADSGTYKLDWYAPDDLKPVELSEEYLTLYEDGVWQFYGKDGEIEGRILRLQDRRWVQRMIDDGVNGQIAYFSVQFFKRLKERR